MEQVIYRIYPDLIFLFCLFVFWLLLKRLELVNTLLLRAIEIIEDENDKLFPDYETEVDESLLIPWPYEISEEDCGYYEAAFKMFLDFRKSRFEQFFPNLVKYIDN